VIGIDLNDFFYILPDEIFPKFFPGTERNFPLLPLDFSVLPNDEIAFADGHDKC
jgi:hypothetical protein